MPQYPDHYMLNEGLDQERHLGFRSFGRIMAYLLQKRLKLND